MNVFTRYRNEISTFAAIMACVMVTRLLFVWLMPATYSNDMLTWPHMVEVLKEGKNPYSTGLLNYPPFWIQVLYGVYKVSEITSISVIGLVQVILAGSEVAVAFLCWQLLRKFFGVTGSLKTLLVAFAFNPILILLTCQHGNIDIIVAFWILLFAWFLLHYLATRSVVSWLAACFFLGIGILTKTIPVILLPLLFVGVKQRERSVTLFGLVLLFSPVALGMSIIYVLDPANVGGHVLGYRSLGGWYGITGFLGRLNAFHLIELYSKISPFMMLGLIGFFSWYCGKRDSLTPQDVVRIALSLLVFIPTFGPGYSPPYILWFLPLLVIYYFLSSAGIRKFLMVGYVITAATYIVEYAFFNSHGAFLSKINPSPQMIALCDELGARPTQVLIRIPMFLFFVSVYVLIARELRASGNNDPKLFRS